MEGEWTTGGIREPNAPYDPDRHHRRSIRLKGYDYGQAAVYFLTICTQERAWLFGTVQNDAVALSPAGAMVQTIWNELPVHYTGVAVDASVVMPNHMHGLVVLAESAAVSLPAVVYRFKSLTTARYRRGVIERRWPAFSGRLWQRNYYEHVVRDEDDLRRIQEYIANNPSRWAEDEYHV